MDVDRSALALLVSRDGYLSLSFNASASKSRCIWLIFFFLGILLSLGHVDGLAVLINLPGLFPPTVAPTVAGTVGCGPPSRPR